MFSNLFDGTLGAGKLTLLLLALLTALAFEFVNGFHDTANAVATVIYTRALKAQYAVVLSGVCNFVGVFLGGIGVAMSIQTLLPVELLVANGTGGGLAMVLAVLTAAILWNIGTWYFGLPASSSHTMIGSIIGVGLANSLRPGHAFGDGVNWSKAQEVGMALILSPVVGLVGAALLLLLMKKLITSPRLYEPPHDETPPPGWIRGLLVATCSGVSFAHGTNDGQKGVGMIMLILIGVIPAGFALDHTATAQRIGSTTHAVTRIEAILAEAHVGPSVADVAAAPAASRDPAVVAVRQLERVRALLDGHTEVNALPRESRWETRRAILVADGALKSLVDHHQLTLPSERAAELTRLRHDLRGLTDYAPTWVLVTVAFALGIGTMFGWKRIVITVGEKIGKAHLTYAQGASAELMAAATIGLSTWAHLPVSTTHVLSSGVAGTMLAQKAGLQMQTVRNIALAWVLTLPVTMVVSGGLYLGFRLLLT